MPRKLIASAAAALCLAVPALAQDLPAPVLEQINAVNANCREFGGNPQPVSGFVTAADLNGDGQPDYIVDLALQNCEGALSAFCGSAGCPVTVWLSGPSGYFVGRSGHAQAWEIEGSTFRGFIHGQMCNPPRTGVDGCEEVRDFRGVTRPG